MPVACDRYDILADVFHEGASGLAGASPWQAPAMRAVMSHSRVRLFCCLAKAAASLLSRFQVQIQK